MDFNHLLRLRVVVLLATLSIAVASVSSAQEPTADVLAAQIRDQGYRCNKAVNAQRDLKRSRPDQAVWVLRCEKRIYRIRLTPDMAARVQRLN